MFNFKEKYKEIKISHEEMSSMLDLQALKTADVVGFTTSGAAKYNNLIKILGSSTGDKLKITIMFCS